MKNSNLFKFITVFLGLFLTVNIASVSAANSNVSVIPATATKFTNETFDITIRATSETPFTAVTANVFPENLIIESLTLNPNITCVKSPSTSSLSFTSCGIFGVNSLNTSLDIYTARVRSSNAGTARINIADTKVSNSAEFFGVSNSNGTFSIIRPANAPASTTTRDGQVQGLETENCIPNCEGKACGDDGCGSICGSCLPGFACSEIYSCRADENFDENAFLTSWGNLPNDDFISIKLDADPLGLVVGLDGNSISGFRFYGTTSANTQVNLYIFSTPAAFSTTSGVNGEWSIRVNEPIENGLHKVYATRMENGIITKNSNVLSLMVDAGSKTVALGGTGTTTTPQQRNTEPEVLGVEETVTENYTSTILLVAFVVVLLGFIFAIILLKRRRDEEYEDEI